MVVREILEGDVDRVIALYRAVYGDDFPFQEFYDATWIKKGIFDDSVLWLVAEQDDRLLGSAAVFLEAGDDDDGVAEVGRLVVHPDARGLDLGTRLIASLDERMDGIECAFAECRTAHPGAQKILSREGFAITGFEPLAYQIGDVRESVVFVTKLYGHARELRRNHPRVIPPVHGLGSLALENLGIPADLLVEAGADPYPVGEGAVAFGPLPDRQAWRLLRLGRSDRLDPEVFGAIRLEHGYLKLVRHRARYLGLERDGALCAGVGYVFDDLDRKVRIFDLVAADDRSRGGAIERALAHVEEQHDPAVITIDVSAYAPRMQQTLHYLGFAPVAYCPSMVFAGGERLDVIRMVKLRVAPRLDGARLIDDAGEVFRIVHEKILDQARGIELDGIARRVQLFRGLSDLQVGEISSACHEVRYDGGEWIFHQGSPDQALFVVLEGAVEIVFEDRGTRATIVEAGKAFGEMALVEGLPRSAGARAERPSRLLVLRPDDFRRLVVRDPALGNVVHRNLAGALSARLREWHDGEGSDDRPLESPVALDDGC